MTLVSEAREIIYQKFQAGWTATPLTQVVFENDDAGGIDAGREPWIRVSTREVGGGQVTLGPKGDRKYDRRALVFVQIFVPSNTGTRRAGQLVEAVRALLEGEALGAGAVDVFDLQVRDARPDGPWNLTLVEAEYRYSETK